MRTHSLQVVGIMLVGALAIVGSFFLADFVTHNGAARELVEQFGFFGVLIISIVTGLNLFIPVPAATFTPMYISAGFPLPLIIVTLVIGTMIADTIGYLIGVGGRHITEQTRPTWQAKMQSFAQSHRRLILPLVFLFAAFSPFPNEMILIPLAVIGIRFRILFIPLILGTTIHQTLLAYGMASAFQYFF